MAEIIEVITREQIEQARNLFGDYRAELVVEDCFARSTWNSRHCRPSTRRPEASCCWPTIVGQPVGCVGLRPFPVGGGVRDEAALHPPGFRGGKIGKQLIDRALQEARLLGYSRLRLDTHPSTMAAAVAIYRKLGFREVTAEPTAAVEGLVYMELQLTALTRIRDRPAEQSGVCLKTNFFFESDCVSGQLFRSPPPLATRWAAELEVRKQAPDAK